MLIYDIQVGVAVFSLLPRPWQLATPAGDVVVWQPGETGTNAGPSGVKE